MLTAPPIPSRNGSALPTPFKFSKPEEHALYASPDPEPYGHSYLTPSRPSPMPPIQSPRPSFSSQNSGRTGEKSTPFDMTTSFLDIVDGMLDEWRSVKASRTPKASQMTTPKKASASRSKHSVAPPCPDATEGGDSATTPRRRRRVSSGASFKCCHAVEFDQALTRHDSLHGAYETPSNRQEWANHVFSRLCNRARRASNDLNLVKEAHPKRERSSSLGALGKKRCRSTVQTMSGKGQRPSRDPPTWPLPTVPLPQVDSLPPPAIADSSAVSGARPPSEFCCSRQRLSQLRASPSPTQSASSVGVSQDARVSTESSMVTACSQGTTQEARAGPSAPPGADVPPPPAPPCPRKTRRPLARGHKSVDETSRMRARSRPRSRSQHVFARTTDPIPSVRRCASGDYRQADVADGALGVTFMECAKVVQQNTEALPQPAPQLTVVTTPKRPKIEQWRQPFRGTRRASRPEDDVGSVVGATPRQSFVRLADQELSALTAADLDNTGSGQPWFHLPEPEFAPSFDVGEVVKQPCEDAVKSVGNLLSKAANVETRSEVVSSTLKPRMTLTGVREKQETSRSTTPSLTPGTEKGSGLPLLSIDFRRATASATVVDTEDGALLEECSRKRVSRGFHLRHFRSRSVTGTDEAGDGNAEADCSISMTERFKALWGRGTSVESPVSACGTTATPGRTTTPRENPIGF